MDIIDNIISQGSYYRRGLLTYSEMLQNISDIVQDEMPRIIECRKGSTGKWHAFSDKQYTKTEATEALEVLNYNALGYQFRITLAR